MDFSAAIAQNMSQGIADAFQLGNLYSSFPNDNCCNLWTEENFEGNLSGNYCIDEGSPTMFYRLSSSASANTKSWMCGKNVYFSACDDNMSEGFCAGTHAHSIAGASQNASRGLDLDISMVAVQWYDSVEGNGAATLFLNEDCTGPSGAFFANKGRDG